MVTVYIIFEIVSTFINRFLSTLTPNVSRVTYINKSINAKNVLSFSKEKNPKSQDSLRSYSRQKKERANIPVFNSRLFWNDKNAGVRGPFTTYFMSYPSRSHCSLYRFLCCTTYSRKKPLLFLFFLPLPLSLVQRQNDFIPKFIGSSFGNIRATVKKNLI